MDNPEQTTQNSDAPNSEATTNSQNSDNPETASSTSTTEQASDDEGIDLGAKPEGDEAAPKGDAEGASDADAGKDGDQSDRDADSAVLFGAPEGDAGYELTDLPEGVTIDADLLAKVSPVAKQLNLSNAGLSLLAKEVLPHVQQQALGVLEGQITEQRRTWETEAREAVAGKVELKNEIGKALSFDGKPMKEVKQVAAKALDHLAPKGFREFLDETGLGVHPMMVALAYNAGKNIAEETDFEASANANAQPKSRVEKYYPARQG